ncbi:sugar transferase [Agrococcus beijingensis]|uniref:sugar transferase n=1 Tax=Agrococcus beijingensis TaxID=3068634 RepID=UPI003BEF2AD5
MELRQASRFDEMQCVAKRALDLVAGLLLLVVLALPMLAIAIALMLDSPGPVLFRQERVGFNGRSFTMLKFRTMHVDAEQRLGTLLDLRVDGDEPGNVVLFKMRVDPRVTRFGALLRRSSLDELPQLFNVLTGDMALVGPRPPLRSEVELYEEHVHRKFCVKPGITGLWQVSGRSNLSWDESVRLDLHYAEHWSLTTDVVILWRTFRAVISGEGAY